MSSAQTNASHTIADYLAGRLSASEADAFEAQLSDHPELRDEIEQTLKFKEGLARLQQRGELKALLRAPPARPWLPYAAAAAVAIAALGTVLWLQLGSRTPLALARSLNGLAASEHELPSVVETYVLARTRGSASAVNARQPQTAGAIEIRVLPSVLSPKTRYSVRLRRVSAPGGNLGWVDAGLAAPDGYVTIYVDSRQLTPGDYELSLAPAVTPGASADTDRFTIRVQ